MLTARQRDLLEAIISEFMQTAAAVGSIGLPDKYELRVSPATIRNEMARLVEMGYLQKPHASSGRVPTTLAFKYFLQDILNELEELDIREQAILGEDIFQKRFNIDQLLMSAVRALNDITKYTAIALIEDKIYHAGLSALLSDPEFQDVSKLKEILLILESYADMTAILTRHRGSDQVRVLIGEETGHSILGQSAIVFDTIPTYSERSGYIAVFGPNRMNYKKVIPAVNYIVERIRTSLVNWQL